MKYNNLCKELEKLLTTELLNLLHYGSEFSIHDTPTFLRLIADYLEKQRKTTSKVISFEMDRDKLVFLVEITVYNETFDK